MRNKLDLVDKQRGWHKYGCIRVHGESKKHFLAKCNKAWELHELGHKFATEVKLKNGRIVDVVDFTQGEFYEFETDKKIKKANAKTVYI